MKTPRKYQTEAAYALFNALDKEGTVHPIAAIPTGAGKTMVMNEFIDCYLTNYPTNKVLVLSHVKEILAQNYDAIDEHFYGVDIGLYSAGLESKNVSQITVAGIQSAYRNPDEFRNFDVIIIDECHRINARRSGMYRNFLKEVGKHYVGLTATPFRTGHGYIHQGKDALFNKLVYNLCDIAGFNMLIDQGYLSPLIAKGTKMKLDTNNLKTRMNDYVVEEMSKRFDREYITNKAVEEVIEFGQPYKKWLVFAIDIKHAEHIAEAFRKRDIPTACVHSKMDGDRDSAITQFKSGKYRCMVNVDILTTGFDAPDIDLIAMLRPTQSPVLHVQTLGRGMRIADGKEHCLVLDFAGNVMRLGPVNDVKISQVMHGTGSNSPRMKECPECGGYLHLAAKVCDYCGYAYPVREKIMPTASTVEIIKRSEIKQDWHDIKSISYFLHSKTNKPNMLKVSYATTNNLTFSEYICYEHEGYAGYKARHWVKFRLKPNHAMPTNTISLLNMAKDGLIHEPKSILVDQFGKYPVIKDVRFS